MSLSKLRFAFICAVVGTLMNTIDHAQAQGIERTSLSGETMAEEMKQSGVDEPYNLRLGPVNLRAETDDTISLNDNIGLTKHDRAADIIVTPGAVLNANWKLSDLNTIHFVIGLGYESYLFHSQYNSLLVSPDSEAQFNLFVGDVLLTFHDSFSYEQDPTSIAQLSNQTRLSRWQNDVGVTATWDLNEIILTLNYDHANLWVTQSVYDYLTNQSDTFSPKVTVKISPTIDAGVAMTFSDVRYEQSFQNDYITYSAGPFVDAKLTKDLSVNAQAGFYLADYSSGGGNGDTQNVSSYYGSVGVNHRIDQFISQSATVGREYIPGLTSNFTQRVYANYNFNWQATKDLNVGGNLLWENLNDSDAAVREDSNRYGAGVSANDNLNKQLSLNFNYQYLIKDATPSYLSYYQNQATFGVNYKF